MSAEPVGLLDFSEGVWRIIPWGLFALPDFFDRPRMRLLLLDLNDLFSVFPSLSVKKISLASILIGVFSAVPPLQAAG